MKATTRIVTCCVAVALMVGCRSIGGFWKPVDYRNPADVRRLVHRITHESRPKPKTVAHSYSSGIAHVDSYIPSNWFMEWSLDDKEHKYRYTYHDGRLVACTFLGDPEYVTDSIWYNENGAPILNCRFSRGEQSDYMLAVFDGAGRISRIYRYSKSFDLVSHKEFTYLGESTRIADFGRDSSPTGETLYENGEVFLICGGEKRKVNNGTRAQSICRPLKFGLKPIYPAY